jgi:hypothetical protein
MYSTKIIEKKVATMEQQTGFKLIRYDVGFVDEMIAHLKRLISDEGKQVRPFTAEEHKFIRNERLLSMLDFRYWCERYCWIATKSKGLDRLRFWRSQEVLLERHLAVEEVRMWDQYNEQSGPVDGILIVLHKARQLGASAISQALLMHRCNFTPDLRALTASVDDEKTQLLFARFERMYDHMPYWMQGELKYKVKDRGMHWSKLDTIYAMQDSKQEAGIGQGETWDVSHITECGAFGKTATKSLENDFFPTIPQSIRALSVLESTAQGRGNWWHRWTEQVRQKRAAGWHYAFVPWYVEPQMYSRVPPDGWEPSDLSMLHAKKVHDTSAEYLGHSIMLTPEQLFWYEGEHRKAYEAGTLNLFLANFCATPEESFQHSRQSAFNIDTLERLQLQSSVPSTPWEILL